MLLPLYYQTFKEMTKNPIELVKNHAGGIDPIIERDAGNPVRILTGKKENSLEFWKHILEVADDVVFQLENGVDNG